MSLFEIFYGGLIIFHVPLDIASIDKQIGILALKIFFLHISHNTASLYALIAFSSSSNFLKLATKLLKYAFPKKYHVAGSFKSRSTAPLIIFSDSSIFFLLSSSFSSYY
jgi:hypothetical protein